MKLYTRTGDDGTTGLFGGERVRKDHPRVEAYGAVDETNACIGLAAAACAGGEAFTNRLRDVLMTIQSRLFDIGADLATPADSAHESKISRTSADDVKGIETLIDEFDGGNDPMKNFILPGGTEVTARLHVARAICRRAERRMTGLSRIADVNQDAVVYMNRLSDLLFAMARRVNKEAGVADVPWVPAKEQD